jgi:hypothetical protein
VACFLNVKSFGQREKTNEKEIRGGGRDCGHDGSMFAFLDLAGKLMAARVLRRGCRLVVV